ncbi:unnamed protein product, partial [Protopolystoma xenopodis]
TAFVDAYAEHHIHLTSEILLQSNSIGEPKTLEQSTSLRRFPPLEASVSPGPDLLNLLLLPPSSSDAHNDIPIGRFSSKNIRQSAEPCSQDESAANTSVNKAEKDKARLVYLSDDNDEVGFDLVAGLPFARLRRSQVPALHDALLTAWAAIKECRSVQSQLLQIETLKSPPNVDQKSLLKGSFMMTP